MSKTVSFDYSKAGKFLGADELQNFKTITLNARDTLLSKTGAGNDFLGWIDLMRNAIILVPSQIFHSVFYYVAILIFLINKRNKKINKQC